MKIPFKKTISEFFRIKSPIIYNNNGVEIGAHINLKCFYIHTPKYIAEWFWKDKFFRVYLRKNLPIDFLDEIFASSIDGGLDLFCQFDPEKKIIIHSSAEDVDTFIERLLSIRAFQ